MSSLSIGRTEYFLKKSKKILSGTFPLLRRLGSANSGCMNLPLYHSVITLSRFPANATLFLSGSCKNSVAFFYADSPENRLG